MMDVHLSARPRVQIPSTITSIAQKAVEAGCDVAPVPRYRKKGRLTAMKTRQLLVNGHACAVFTVKSKRRTNGSVRLTTGFSTKPSVLQSFETLIVHTKVEGYPEHVFVVPTTVLCSKHFRPGMGEISFRLPLEKLPEYHGVKQRIDWWSYEDAWHLLSKAPVSQ